MTSVKEGNAVLLSQCLEFCQTLSSKSLTFSFALTVGDSFSFSLDTRGEVALVPKAKKNKKKTPSALRRNARRRAEFLRKKLEASTVDSTQCEQVPLTEAIERAIDEKAFKCDQCDNIFKSENGLKIHVGKAHKKAISSLATPDRLRQQVEGSVSPSASPLLESSPLLDASMEEVEEEKEEPPPSPPSGTLYSMPCPGWEAGCRCESCVYWQNAAEAIGYK